MTDYYQILGLPAGASATEVKNAYHKLALKYHPDKNPNNTNAEYIFKQITEAYNCLSNPADKLLYDMQFSVQQQSRAHVYRDDKKIPGSEKATGYSNSHAHHLSESEKGSRPRG